MPDSTRSQPLALTFQQAITAGLDAVWALISTSDGRAAWFGTDAAIDLRVGGASRVTWSGEQPIDGVVREVDAPNRLKIAYEIDGQELGAEEYLLDHEAGVTTVRLIQSMPPDDHWGDWYGDLERGWRLFLASLDFAASRAAHPTRTAECRFVPVRDGREAGWERVLSALGLTGVPTVGARVDTTVLASAVVDLADPPHSLLLTTPTRTVVCDLEGSGDHLQLYVQAASHAGTDNPDERAWRAEALRHLAVSQGQ